MTDPTSAPPRSRTVGKLRLERKDPYRWTIPRQGTMRVEGLIFGDDLLMEQLASDERAGSVAVRQVANVASLPGIVEHSIGMPDIHMGYGFVIGGVAAFDPEEGGVISPGGVGYDINCGVRLLRSDLHEGDLRPRIGPLMNQIMRDVPAGVGSEHDRFRLSEQEVRDVMVEGSAWAVRRGFGTEDDLTHTEAGGRFPAADPEQVSDRALKRGRPQLGTVGSGNHFVEIGFVDRIFDPGAADKLGLEDGTVCVLIHSGSRGLGYQVCEDYLELMLDTAGRHGIDLPDDQLACAPLESPEAQRYFGAMNGAANYAFTNRHVMAHRVREAFARILERPWEEMGISQIYDVAHNMAKWEEHEVGGRSRRLCVHRKGATRAFPPGHPEVVDAYRGLGQPVLIPGDMGRYSYVMVGTDGAYRETFGSTCHGAGRVMSRTAARKSVGGRSIRKELEERGIVVRAADYGTVAEEIPEAYKDVANVVDVVHGAGIARKVARLKPMGVLKG